MDDATAILLSRYVDDDLPAEEKERLEAALANNEALTAELDRYRALRQAVRQVVRTVEPPQRLDAVVEPLRMGPPDRAGVRPAVRWLAAAAAAVIGVTVAVEVARRQPGPITPAGESPVAGVARPQPTRTPGYFQLQPLPRFVDESGEERLGAADRLLATPHAEAEVAQPEALEVIGPLPNEVEARAAGIEGATETEREVGGNQGAKRLAKGRSRAELLGPSAGATAGAQAAAEGFAGRSQAAVLTFIVGATARSVPVRADELPPAGSYPVVLTIVGGKVRAIGGRGAAVAMNTAGWRAVTNAVVGLPVAGVDDGPLNAALEVGITASEEVGDRR